MGNKRFIFKSRNNTIYQADVLYAFKHELFHKRNNKSTKGIKMHLKQCAHSLSCVRCIYFLLNGISKPLME